MVNPIILLRQHSGKLFILGILILCLLFATSESCEPFTLFEKRYGLRGDELNTSDIKNKFYYPESNWKLNPTSGVVYESGHAPIENNNCAEGDCPPVFDRNDSQTKCWNC